MNTLRKNELATITGGFEALTDWGGSIRDITHLQLAMDQLAREQEAAFLRDMIMHQAD